MKVSQLMASTLRQTEGYTPGMEYLLRAGYLRKPLADSTILLPLGEITVRRLQVTLEETLLKMGGSPISLPVHYDGEFWQKAGVSTPLPEDSRALLVHLAGSEIASYRQLPKTVWQTRPGKTSGSGRVMEAWILAAGSDQLQAEMAGLAEAVKKILEGWGIVPQTVKADPGAAKGNSESLVFSFGEGKYRYLVAGDNAAEKEMAISLKDIPPKETPAPLEKVHTPGTKSIQDLCDFLNISPVQTAKVVFYTATVVRKKAAQLVIAVIRGDMEVNEAAVRRHAEALDLRPATEEEIAAVGCVAGFASPVNISRENVLVLADDAVIKSQNLVAGANEVDYHLKNVCYGRDYEADKVADIALVSAGGKSPDGLVYSERHGILLGQVYNGGSWYGEVLETTFMSEQGKPEPLFLGQVRLDLEAILLALAEQHHDEDGLVWPSDLAPFDVALISLEDAEETSAAAVEVYQLLTQKGLRVLLDDRHKKVAGPGVKFKDADLQGIPLRITASKRALGEGGLEVKWRHKPDREIIPLAQIESYIQARR